VNGRHGQLRTRVERAGAFSGITGANQVELACCNDMLDEAFGFLIRPFLVFPVRLILFLLWRQPGQHDRLTRPVERPLPRISGDWWLAVGGQWLVGILLTVYDTQFTVHLVFVAIHLFLFTIHYARFTIHFFLFLPGRYGRGYLLFPQLGKQVFESLGVMVKHGFEADQR